MKFRFPKTVEKIEDVPEKFRALYEEGETGGFQLVEDPRIASSVEAIRGAFGALDAERAAHRATQTQIPDLTPLAEYGDSPANIATRIRELQEAARKASENGVSVEQAVNQAREAWQTQHQKDSGLAKSKIDSLTSQLTRLTVDAEIDRHVDRLNPTKAGKKFFQMLMKEQVRGELDETGQMRVSVVAPDGKRRFSGSDRTPDGSMTIEELADELAGNQDYAAYIASQAPAGGGARPQDQLPTGAPRVPRAEQSSLEKIKTGLRKKQYLDRSRA